MKERLATVIYAIFSLIALCIFAPSILFLLFGNNDMVGFGVGTAASLIFYGIGWSIRYIITGDKNSILISLLSKIKRKNKGHIIEDDTHKQLLKKKGHYTRMWEMQAGGFLPESDNG